MNREKLYFKTVDILLDAYNNGTLLSGNCYACAVGNLVAANMGFRYEKVDNPILSTYNLKWEGFPNYGDLSSIEDGRTKIQRLTWIGGLKYTLAGNIIESKRLSEKGRAQLESTGYTMEEIGNIEYSFEYPLVYGFPCTNEGRLSSVLLALEKIHSIEKKVETKLQTLLNEKAQLV